MLKKIWLTLNVVLYWLVMFTLYLIVAIPYAVYKLGFSRGRKQEHSNS